MGDKLQDIAKKGDVRKGIQRDDIRRCVDRI